MTRCLRSYLLFAVVLLSTYAIDHIEAQTRSVVATSHSPHAAMQGSYLDDATWTGGIWNRWAQITQQHSVPLLYDLANAPGRGDVQNFEIAADLRQGPYQGNHHIAHAQERHPALLRIDDAPTQTGPDQVDPVLRLEEPRNHGNGGLASHWLVAPPTRLA